MRQCKEDTQLLIYPNINVKRLGFGKLCLHRYGSPHLNQASSTPLRTPNKSWI